MATAYARSKAKADAALAGLDVNWLVVKPSLVIGRGSYGGTLLMRGLAGLPLVLPLPGKAAERFQPIAADDLAHGIAHLAARDEPARTTLYAAGTETVSIRDILVAYRAWLGFGRAPEVTIPLPLLSLLLPSAISRASSATTPRRGALSARRLPRGRQPCRTAFTRGASSRSLCSRSRLPCSGS